MLVVTLCSFKQLDKETVFKASLIYISRSNKNHPCLSGGRVQ